MTRPGRSAYQAIIPRRRAREADQPPAARNGGTARSARGSRRQRSLVFGDKGRKAMPNYGRNRAPAACTSKAEIYEPFICGRNSRASASAAGCSPPPRRDLLQERVGRAWWVWALSDNDPGDRNSIAPSAAAWSRASSEKFGPKSARQGRLRLDQLRGGLFCSTPSLPGRPVPELDRG